MIVYQNNFENGFGSNVTVEGTSASKSANSGHAAYTAYTFPLGDGNQDYVGSLGMDFDVNKPIQITDIGVFEPNQDGITSGTILTVERPPT